MKNFMLFLLVVIMFAPLDKLSEITLPAYAAMTNEFDDEAIEGEFANCHRLLFFCRYALLA